MKVDKLAAPPDILSNSDSTEERKATNAVSGRLMDDCLFPGRLFAGRKYAKLEVFAPKTDGGRSHYCDRLIVPDNVFGLTLSVCLWNFLMLFRLC